MIKSINDIKFIPHYIWAVAQIGSEREHEIERYFNNYKPHINEISIPEFKEIEYVKGKRLEVDKPIFPGYLLVQIKKHSPIWSVIEAGDNFVYRFITARNRKKQRQLLYIKEHEMDILRKIFQKVNNYGVDKRVKIKSGLLKDFEGKIFDIFGLKVRILLDGILKRVVVDIDNLHLIDET